MTSGGPLLTTIGQLLDSLPPLVSSEGVLLYGIGGLFSLICAARASSWYRHRQPTEPSLGQVVDEETLTAARVEREVLDDIAERHRAVLAAPAIEWDTRAARVGHQWTTTLSITEYPDVPTDGYLSGLFELTDVAIDLTARCVPKDQGRARSELKRVAEDLQVDANLERSVRKTYLQERATEAVATYNAVENGQRVFDQELVVTVRAETREKLQRAVKSVRATLRSQPANLEPKPAICTQDLALQTAAPVGASKLDSGAVALGGAVGALLASPHHATVLEDDGVEFGSHSDTKSPVVIDPFAREDGYAMFTVGDPGSGKSFSAKQNFVRTLARDPDRIGVILEPLGNWRGVAEALGGRHVTVGGTLGLNPLEIKPTPDHVLRERGQDASPLREKRDRVVSFFTNYFALRDVNVGDRRTTLELAIDEVYERRGITADPSTHDRESPTIRDVLDVLEVITREASGHVVRVEAEGEKIKADALWLLDQLRPFAEGGQLENLGRHSEFDIRDEKVLYLDLLQQGGSIGGHTSLLMELLISLVYERAKESDKEVVFVIDEARYLMKDAETLEYLETIFRHHRHHDLSIRLVTQTVDEFLAHDIAKIILDQCAIKQFHKLDGMDQDIAEIFGLNHPQMRFVQNALPGEQEQGYSEALLGVDGEWRGIEVRGLDRETAVIENEVDRTDSASASMRARASGDD